MVKTADSRLRQRLTRLGRTRLNRTLHRRLLLQSDVGSVLMVVSQVVAPEAPQVLFIQRNDMIQHLAAAATHPALGHPVGDPDKQVQDSIRFLCDAFRRGYWCR